jgi:hypothetical protein
VLGYETLEDRGDQVEIAQEGPTIDAIRQHSGPPTLVFVRVPESKTVKNRLHMDVSPIDRGLDEEVDRLIALGARRVDVGQGEKAWVVLGDPEGNEFCVLRSLHPDHFPWRAEGNG